MNRKSSPMGTLRAYVPVGASSGLSKHMSRTSTRWGVLPTDCLAMGNEFCTLFDAHYLPRGLVLYQSLAAVCERFHLRVFCMDGETKHLLDRLELPSLEVTAVSEVEGYDPELPRVKLERSPIEYCWTITPSVCLYVLETEPQLDMITFLDA